MADSFYWYDLETSGTNTRWDRVVQFAGMRTDAELNPIGDEVCEYFCLPHDVLPNPDAALVTGITPQLTHEKGLSELAGFRKILQQFLVPQSCVAGYNSLRFDDEFVRHGLYRLMLDPYVREYQNGNSRWDLIDLVRATGALRRDGINWPQDEDGLPVYRLEELTRANGLEHGQAHDAMSDVRATVGLARLIRDRQPRLFDYYFNCRRKRAIKELLEPIGARLCVHVSGMYPRPRFGTAPIISVCRHPTNSNSVIVIDLAEDVEMLLEATPDEIRQSLFTRGNENRPPIKEIRINRCPFVADFAVVNEENLARLQLHPKLIRERMRRLNRGGGLASFGAKIAQVFSKRKQDPPEDVEDALYDGFLRDNDRSRCNALHQSLDAGEWQDLDYSDKRLVTLSERLKARELPELLSDTERSNWQSYVRGKLHTNDGPWLGLDEFNNRLSELMAERATDEAAMRVLRALQTHGEQVAALYP